MIITTDRLVLNTPEERDRDKIAEEMKRPEIFRYLYVPTNYSLKDAEEFIQFAKNSNGYYDGQLLWAIRFRQDINQDLQGIFELRKSGSLGFWISKEARGQGIVLEALEGVIEKMRTYINSSTFALDNFQIPELLIHETMNVNLSSSAIALKAGFTFHGVRNIPSPQENSPHRLDSKRYFQWTEFQNCSYFLLSGSKAEQTQSIWPASVLHGKKYATKIEDYFNDVYDFFKDANEVKTTAHELLDAIGINQQFRSCAYGPNSNTYKKWLSEKLEHSREYEEFESYAIRNLDQYTYNTLMKIAEIPFGQTRTYSEIDPKSPRIVGTICKHNPFPILIPCHRVVPKTLSKQKPYGEYVFGLTAKKNFLEKEATNK